MAKKRKYEGGMRMKQGKPARVVETHNGERGVIMEDWSKPCGIPYGAVYRDISNGPYLPTNSYKVEDLYEGVEKAMREDSAGLRKIVKPTNW